MRRLIYFSKSTSICLPGDIPDILSVSRDQNLEAAVTGVLIYMDGVFMQVLEGEEAEVYATMNRIKTDPRHNEIYIFSDEEIDTRVFGEWTMGFLNAEASALLEAAGLRDIDEAMAIFAEDGPWPGAIINQALRELSLQLQEQDAAELRV